MRMRISHDTVYHYENPAASVIQTLRLTPRNHDGQYVGSWRIDVSCDCRLDAQEDAFGNLTHHFTAEGPIEKLVVHVEGEAEIENTNGVVRGTIERFPPALYLRETPLTRPDHAIVEFANDLAGAKPGDTLGLMHAVLGALNERIVFDADPTQSTTTAGEAFALGRGVCQDLTHIFIAAARHLGVPARYVSGYFHRADGVVEQDAGHAWAEAYLPELGWIAFDPTNGICATDAYLRIAVGLDYLSAAPVRGTRYGGGGEELSVHVKVDQAGFQAQN